MRHALPQRGASAGRAATSPLTGATPGRGEGAVDLSAQFETPAPAPRRRVSVVRRRRRRRREPLRRTCGYHLAGVAGRPGPFDAAGAVVDGRRPAARLRYLTLLIVALARLGPLSGSARPGAIRSAGSDCPRRSPSPTARCDVPDEPIIPFIEGDGTGVDIWPAAQLRHGRRRDEARQDASPGRRCSPARRRSTQTGDWLPEATVDAFREHLIGIKGPLTTPVGGGIRSLNVALRQILDLYVCLRPVRWFTGRAVAGEAPREGRHGDLPGEHRGHLRRPRGRGGHARGEEAHRAAARRVRLGHPARLRHRHQAGLGDRLEAPRSAPPSSTRSSASAASVTLVHKGNIQKFTEGAFRNWGYELVREEFSDVAVGWDDCGGDPGDKILVKDNIADITLQQVLTRPDEFDVIATTNLNGDYLSDALAAQVGGIGIAPGGNINYVTGHGVFEATHGTAPEVRRPGQGEPGLGAAVGRDDVRAPRLAGRGRRHRARARGHHRRQDRHLRLRPPHGGRHRGQDLGVRVRHRRPPARLDVHRGMQGA